MFIFTKKSKISTSTSVASSSYGYAKKLAFTLAEVLIVLGLLGIIAELTIPTVLGEADTKSTVSGLKTAFSLLSEAYQMATIENGQPAGWDISTSEKLYQMFTPHLKLTKDCGTTEAGCTPSMTYRLTGEEWVDFNSTVHPRVVLANGMWVLFFTYNTKCTGYMGVTPTNACGAITVDINGLKKPNTSGKDLFEFYLTSKGVVPIGAPADTSTGGSFDATCKNKATGSGEGCAGWVIYNENKDYLKCSDLNWSTKKSCN